ncbi:family 20 glycosylhydrolase [Specibacter sp. AOP5-B1-6]|uniref:family 20 glycosylhydrolase n=1 Tax=Specibacter sp. AOP5-B1-6 TaxID=3457653 RepID=UPI00402BDE5B
MGPQTIPAVQRWMDDGVTSWVLPSRPRVVVQEQDVSLLGQLAAQLASDLGVSGELGAVHIPSLDGGSGGSSEPGDILLELCTLDGVQLTPEQQAESYRITAGEVLTITAPAPAGAYYGTRTLLQLLRRGGAVTGTITDWPAFAQRGVMVDVGRKYFTPAWLKRLIADMGWLKLNLLHLHLSDNAGVGLECTSHPKIVSERHLSYSDLEEILAVAATHHVTVVPEFDTPSHAASIVSQHPGLALTDRHGAVAADKLNVADAAARSLVADVVLEWADHFPGPYFHLGGDEFFAAPWEPEEHRNPLRFPGLAAWAEQETGSMTSTPLDGYVLYLNELNTLLRENGKQVRVWNDHIHPGIGGVRLDWTIDVDVWIRWNASQPSAGALYEAGHRLVNRNGDHLYFLLSAEDKPAVTGRKSAQGVYELWHPHRFMGSAGSLDDDLDPAIPVAGAVMSIWCDDPSAMTEEQVAEQAIDWFRSLAQQLWGSPKPFEGYAEFRGLFGAIGTSPPDTGDRPCLDT